MYKFENFFLNKKILITGHTGFKGSWLTLWLYLLGAKIIGVSKDLPTKPSHFNELKIKKKIIHKKLDITNLKKLHEVFKKHKPDLVFHLAAQSLVKKSYNNPVETYTSNTIGTLNLLECIRKSNHKCSSVFITSDKSYKNLEIERGLPAKIRVDNGPEFISYKLKDYCKEKGIHLEHIKPGTPTQNAYVERFNRTFREDVLDAYLFSSLTQVNIICEKWKNDYNDNHPHKSLGYKSPRVFKELFLTKQLS